MEWFVCESQMEAIYFFYNIYWKRFINKILLIYKFLSKQNYLYINYNIISKVIILFNSL
jgi:hypothetical protein